MSIKLLQIARVSINFFGKRAVVVACPKGIILDRVMQKWKINKNSNNKKTKTETMQDQHSDPTKNGHPKEGPDLPGDAHAGVLEQF